MPCVPVAPSTNVGNTVSSVLLFAVAVTVVANVARLAVPVRSAVTVPNSTLSDVPTD